MIFNFTLSATIAEYTDVIGLNDYRLRGAIAGYFRFNDAHSNGDTVTFHVTDGPNIEIVTGVFTAPDILSRVTILTSSNNGNKINWSGLTRPFLRKVELDGLFIISFSEPSAFTDRAIDEWDSKYNIFSVVMPFEVVYPADFSSSPVPGCEIAPALNDVVLTFQKIHLGTPTTVGTLTILTGATVGTLATSGGGFVVPANDRLRLYAEEDVDDAIIGAYGTVMGNR